MTYRELRVRLAGKSHWENLAIDEMHIEVVKRSNSPNICLVYDTDDVLCFEVLMPYEKLVAKLNGEPWPVPKKAEPVAVSQWVWVDRCGCFVICDGESEAKKHVCRTGGYAVELKGEYTP